MSFEKTPSDKAGRGTAPESVEPVTLSDRVNAVIQPPRPDPFAGRRLPKQNGLTDELAHESADDAGETDDTGKAAVPTRNRPKPSASSERAKTRSPRATI